MRACGEITAAFFCCACHNMMGLAILLGHDVMQGMFRHNIGFYTTVTHSITYVCVNEVIGQLLIIIMFAQISTGGDIVCHSRS